MAKEPINPAADDRPEDPDDDIADDAARSLARNDPAGEIAPAIRPRMIHAMMPMNTTLLSSAPRRAAGSKAASQGTTASTSTLFVYETYASRLPGCALHDGRSGLAVDPFNGKTEIRVSGNGSP